MALTIKLERGEVKVEPGYPRGTSVDLTVKAGDRPVQVVLNKLEMQALIAGLQEAFKK